MRFIVSLIFLITALILVLCTFYLPENIATQLSASGRIDIEELGWLLNPLNFLSVATLLLGLVVIALSGEEPLADMQVPSSSDDLQKPMQSKQRESIEQTKELEPIDSLKQTLENDITAISKSSSNPLDVLDPILSRICHEVEACQGAIYLAVKTKGKRMIKLHASYAFPQPETEEIKYEFGEGLAGQVAKYPKAINLKSVPKGYIRTVSGLGDTTPQNLIITPILADEDLLGVMEIASFRGFSKSDVLKIESVVSLVSKQLKQK